MHHELTVNRCSLQSWQLLLTAPSMFLLASCYYTQVARTLLTMGLSACSTESLELLPAWCVAASSSLLPQMSSVDSCRPSPPLRSCSRWL
jgi:hypothetical protein